VRLDLNGSFALVILQRVESSVLSIASTAFAAASFVVL